MASVDLDIMGFVGNAVTDSIHFLNRLFTGDSHKRTIFIIFKRNEIYVEKFENRNPSNEYPKLVKKEGNILYYRMPLGMSYKQIEKIEDVFESSLKAQVSVRELKDHPDAHFSITITEKTA